MITVESVIHVINVPACDVHPETIYFFENNEGTVYSDSQKLKEHLYTLDDPDFNTEDETLIVQAEVKELIELAKKHAAVYLRFIF